MKKQNEYKNAKFTDQVSSSRFSRTMTSVPVSNGFYTNDDKLNGHSPLFYILINYILMNMWTGLCLKRWLSYCFSSPGSSKLCTKLFST